MDREHARLKEEKKQDANTKPWADCVVVVDYEEWSRSPSSVFYIDGHVAIGEASEPRNKLLNTRRRLPELYPL